MSVETSSSTASTELTLEKVRNRRDELIQNGFDRSETTLIEALPASGKSYGVTQWAKETGNPLTVLAPRHTILDEYVERCEEFGLDYWRVPSFFRDCESFDEDGEPLSYGAEKLKEEYNRGKGGEQLHAEHNNLHCQQNGPCQFTQKKNADPSGYSVLLGTYRHAFVTDWIEDRYVAFDEFPQDAFLKEFDDGIAPIVSAYLEYTDEIPYDKYKNYDDRDGAPLKPASMEEWKASLDNLPSSPYDFAHVHQSANPDAHTLGPVVTLAIYEAMDIDNDWQYAPLGDGRIAVRNPKENKWTFLFPPDLNEAESVIAMDGTPNKRLWELVLNEELSHRTLLDLDERKTFLQEILDYRFIQTTEYLKAIQSGKGASPPKDLALVEGIKEKEERLPSFISSRKAIRQYEPHGLDEITDLVMYYGNLKGSNELEEKRLGIISGSPHPEDDQIEMWAALAGESAERDESNDEIDFGPFGNAVRHTLLDDEVLQAAMRFGREKDEEGNRGATVYIHTSAFPQWVPVEKQCPEIHSWTTGDKGMKQTINAIRSVDGWNYKVWDTTQLYDQTDLSNRQVRNCLDDLVEEGYIQYEEEQGKRPKHYSNICLEDAGDFGHVEFRS